MCKKTELRETVISIIYLLFFNKQGYKKAKNYVLKALFYTGCPNKGGQRL